MSRKGFRLKKVKCQMCLSDMILISKERIFLLAREKIYSFNCQKFRTVVWRYIYIVGRYNKIIKFLSNRLVINVLTDEYYGCIWTIIFNFWMPLVCNILVRSARIHRETDQEAISLKRKF